jgi:hypothetical protein
LVSSNSSTVISSSVPVLELSLRAWNIVPSGVTYIGSLVTISLARLAMLVSLIRRR